MQRKKKTSATGPDQVSRQDLLQLPDDLTEALLDLISRVEAGQEWPVQTIEAAVTALEKMPGASKTNDFRPIAVLSMMYRTWASMGAKEALIGNQPHKTTAEVCYPTQLEMEQAFYDGTTMSGYVTDEVKCFNVLPRIPVMALARQYGFPTTLVQPWQRALAQVSASAEGSSAAQVSLKETR